jgi:hypothetical protein
VKERRTDTYKRREPDQEQNEAVIPAFGELDLRVEGPI